MRCCRAGRQRGAPWLKGRLPDGRFDCRIERGLVKLRSRCSRKRQMASLSRGQAEGLYTSPRFIAKDAAGAVIEEKSWGDGIALGHAGAPITWLPSCANAGRASLIGVGHRVVHGGLAYTKPVRVDAQVVTTLQKYVPLQHCISRTTWYRSVHCSSGCHIPQVACFDAAFHRSQPPVAQAFALPKRITERGVIRYGFRPVV